MTNSIDKHKRLKIPYTKHGNSFLIIYNSIRQTKSESKAYIKDESQNGTFYTASFLGFLFIGKSFIIGFDYYFSLRFHHNIIIPFIKDYLI